jgi:cytochrome c oxidase cbb3-type subunit III
MEPILQLRSPGRAGNATKYLFTILALLAAPAIYAQQNKAPEYDTISLFSNPLFFALLLIVLLLLVIIIALGSTLVNVAAATKDKWGKGTMLTIGLAVLMFSAKDGNAQTDTAATIPALNTGIFYLMLTIIGFETLIIIVLLRMIRLFTMKDELKGKKKIPKPSILEKLNASVAVEKEEEILFDHVYDGIRELDNDLPPWWKYGFYLTIVFAFVYMVHYHVIATGDLQKAEYDKSILKAKLEKDEFDKMNATNVTESSVIMLTDKSEIAKGETVFKESCFACHGKLGEGGVGPNLTDGYWLHGGSIKDIFKSIKYGWPDKGMKSWQADLSPVQIHQISSYIMTLRGTNPPNAKEKQGDLYTAPEPIAKDSLASDSTVVDSIPADIK